MPFISMMTVFDVQYKHYKCTSGNIIQMQLIDLFKYPVSLTNMTNYDKKANTSMWDDKYKLIILDLTN